MAKALSFWSLPAKYIALTVSALLTFALASPALAADYTGTYTGYAMGNLNGAAGIELVQGHFANHSNNWCPGDPASFWAFGTGITTQSPSYVNMHNQNGSTYSRAYFELRDIGDLQCTMGNYWVDAYFGRWKPQADACSCNNGTEVCYLGTANTCTDAKTFGRFQGTYTKW